MVRESVIQKLENEEMYKNHFDLHSVTLRNKDVKLYTVIQEVNTNLPLEAIKKNSDIMKYLKDQKIQLNNK